jgi:peptidoglycan hydrolase CwlO-like protein
MKKFFSLVVLLVVILSFLLSGAIFVIRADVCDDSPECSQIKKDLERLNAEVNSQTADYQKLSKQLDDIKTKVTILGQEIKNKEIEVEKGEKALIYQKELLNERAKSYYKNVNKNSTLFLSVLVADDL